MHGVDKTGLLRYEHGPHRLWSTVLVLVLLQWLTGGCACHNRQEVRVISEENVQARASQWLDSHRSSPQDYFVGLFKEHQVVIFGEQHNRKEHKEFLLGLVDRLYHEADVRCIAWEFSAYRDNAWLEELVTAETFDPQAALNFARKQSGHEWSSKEHWDMIAAVWNLNHTLGTGPQRMRLIGLDSDIDWPRYGIAINRTKPDSPEHREVMALYNPLRRDKEMAEHVECEILQKGIKGLVFVGREHDFTHHEFAADVNYGRAIMGNLLYKKYGDAVFQVWPSSIGMLPAVDEVMRLRGNTPVGFDLYRSPLAGTPISETYVGLAGFPASDVARGYLFLGPTEHRVTAIRGFVTEEMFGKYREYYESDLGRAFKNAREVDEYLYEHRWPKLRSDD